MSYIIEYSSSAQKVIKKWKKSNPRAFNKFRDLLPELEQHPRTGTGHPEPLKGGNDVTWSRHITAHDRIIYDIYDNILTVLISRLKATMTTNRAFFLLNLIQIQFRNINLLEKGLATRKTAPKDDIRQK